MASIYKYFRSISILVRVPTVNSSIIVKVNLVERHSGFPLSTCIQDATECKLTTLIGTSGTYETSVGEQFTRFLIEIEFLLN